MYKKRDLFTNLSQHLYAEAYSIIIGARQTGKTTILKQLRDKLNKNNETTYYISFEDISILNSINKHPENIFKFVKKPEADEKIFILIDEIQYAENPSNFLKFLYDTYDNKIKIIATGSSAFYIDTKFNDSLAGRKRIFHLKQLNFSEFLEFKELENLKEELELIRKEKDYISLNYKELMYYFDEYLIFGAYPAVVLENNIDEKKWILKDLKNSFIKKDIQEANIINDNKFYALMQILAAHTGNLLNRNELAKTLSLDNKTIERYVYVLEKSFHIRLLKPFFSNIKKEITKMPKIYFYDFGLRNSLLNNFMSLHERTDKGELFENYIFIRLHELYQQEQLKFWRTAGGQEVDFVAEEIYGKGQAYEVKFSEKAVNRKKYNLFNENYKNYKLKYITYNYDEAEDIIQALKL